MRHRPALDGLRALAVLAVVANHTGASVFAGGYLGVDVFFVLSGFLITTLLLLERESADAVRLRDFYARRALRLYPALLLTVGLGTMLVVVGTIRGGAFGLHVLHSLTYVQDLAINFGWLHELGPLNHTWSLAIEEHFYLLWPPLLLVLYRWRGRAAVAIGSLVGALLCWLIMLAVFAPSSSPTAAVYYRPDARSAGLLLGCALAARPFRLPPWTATAAIAAIVLGLAAAPIANVMAVYALWMPLIWLATSTFIAARDDSSVAARLISWPPLVAIGVVSYGIYLFHPLIFTAVRDETSLSRLPASSLGAVLAFAMAFASYHLVEKRFLRLKRFVPGARSVERPAGDISPVRLGPDVASESS